jgi:hypothetical protein
MCRDAGRVYYHLVLQPKHLLLDVSEEEGVVAVAAVVAVLVGSHEEAGAALGALSAGASEGVALELWEGRSRERFASENVAHGVNVATCGMETRRTA